MRAVAIRNSDGCVLDFSAQRGRLGLLDRMNELHLCKNSWMVSERLQRNPSGDSRVIEIQATTSFVQC